MRLAPFIVFSFALTLTCGCGQGTHSSTATSSEHADHDHDHAEAHPETLPEAVDAIAKMCASIVDAFKGGNPEAAHDDLHEIGHLIEELPELSKEAKLSAEASKKVDEATEKLMAAFGALDDSLHGGQGKSVDDVELEVDWCLKELKSVMPQ